MIKTNSIKAWLLATRPQTLTAAAVPVLLGIALGIKRTSPQFLLDHGASLNTDGAGMAGGIRWIPALLCLLFAWVMQIDSNLVNDYFDFKHGNDDETRLGPKRACAEGWITLEAMKRGILITTLIGCAIGLPLIVFGGWEMVIVGICCVIFCFLYTTTLSYLGLGDLLVLVFFGIVPVCCTYYLVLPPNMQNLPMEVIATSIACGLVVDTLLILNNYRDHDNDQRAGKKTLVVHIGKKNAERLYATLGYLGILIVIAIDIYSALKWNANDTQFLPLAAVYIILHYMTYTKMKKIGEGRELNKILGWTALNIFCFGIVSSLIIIGIIIL